VETTPTDELVTASPATLRGVRLRPATGRCHRDAAVRVAGCDLRLVAPRALGLRSPQRPPPPPPLRAGSRRQFDNSSSGSPSCEEEAGGMTEKQGRGCVDKVAKSYWTGLDAQNALGVGERETNQNNKKNRAEANAWMRRCRAAAMPALWHGSSTDLRLAAPCKSTAATGAPARRRRSHRQRRPPGALAPSSAASMPPLRRRAPRRRSVGQLLANGGPVPAKLRLNSAGGPRRCPGGTGTAPERGRRRPPPAGRACPGRCPSGCRIPSGPP